MGSLVKEEILTQHGRLISLNPLIRNATIDAGRGYENASDLTWSEGRTIFFGATAYHPC